MKEYPERPEIFNVRFDDITLSEAVKRAEDMLRDDSWHYIVGTNANLLRIARHEKKYRDVIGRADLSLADGYGVICASHILGVPLAERVPCMDLLNALLPRLFGIRVFILGGRPGIAEKAENRLKEQYPGLIVCGSHHGFFQDPEEMAKKIAQCRPELLLVCLGSPKQEFWMAEYGPATGARLRRLDRCLCGGSETGAGKLAQSSSGMGLSVPAGTLAHRQSLSVPVPSDPCSLGSGWKDPEKNNGERGIAGWPGKRKKTVRTRLRDQAQKRWIRSKFARISLNCIFWRFSVFFR